MTAQETASRTPDHKLLIGAGATGESPTAALLSSTFHSDFTHSQRGGPRLPCAPRRQNFLEELRMWFQAISRKAVALLSAGCVIFSPLQLRADQPHAATTTPIGHV